MRYVSIREWWHHLHGSSGHGGVVRLEHAMHDRQFWAVVIGIVGAGALVGLMIWLAGTANMSGDAPRLPLSPFGPGYPLVP